MENNIRIFGLGGLDEFGKNMYVIEVDNDIFVIDAGNKIPMSADRLGVEIIIPDLNYLIANKKRIKAIFITKGQQDNIGALPYLLKKVNAPIYTTPLTGKLITKLLTKHKIKNPKINIIKRNQGFIIDKYTCETFPVTQSMPDGFGIAIKTRYGYIVYTSDFLVDYNNTNEYFETDMSKFAQIGKSGVFALLSEARGSLNAGYTAPKHKISNIIETYFENCKGRLLFTIYKQNIYRLIEIIELCKKYKFKVHFHNDDQLELLEMINNLGYYKIPKDLVISAEQFGVSDNNVVCIVTGTGERAFKRMHKIAIREDENIQLRETDVVIIASPAAYETEVAASSMENDLYKENVKVVTISAKQVLSMHASEEDVKMMLYLLKPRYYIPINGEYRHLVACANLATDMKLTPDRIILLDNGQIAQFEKGRLSKTSEVIELNEELIDGNEKLDVGGLVLRDRETLSSDGVIVIGIVINHKTKEVIGGPDIQSRGVIYLKEADYILKKITDIVTNEIKNAKEKNKFENMQVRLSCKEKITKYLLKETGKRPMVLPAIIEINEGK